MAATIIDFINYLTVDKVSWNDLSEDDKKAFSPFMINKWLSMNPELCQIVNVIQKYTLSSLDKKDVYKFYYDFLPKKKIFLKYIKSSELESKVSDKLVNYVQEYYEVSKREAKQYASHLLENNKDEIISLLKRKFAMEDKDIQKLIK